MSITATAPQAQSPIAFARRPRDLGRLAFMPVCVLLMTYNCMQLVSGALYSGKSAGAAVGLIVASSLTTVFYGLVVRAYLVRLPAKATSRSAAANLAAFLGSAVPFFVPLLRRTMVGGPWLVAGDVLLLAGLAWTVWAVRTLGRSFSVIPQARTVVSTGPYRLVRHPLYFGEIVSTLGLALLHFSAANLVAWLSLCALQIYRAGHEERVLGATLLDYDDYRSRTRRIVPALY